MRVYQIEVSDLTHLGGPMGTEYTTTIETKLAAHVAGLDRLWSELQKKYRVPSTPRPMSRNKVYDFGHVGFRITSEEVTT